MSRKLQHNLLEEAESRLTKLKQASLNKEGMAYWANAPERNNMLANLRVFEIEKSERIDEIASEIADRLSKFLLERTPHVGDMARGTRRTKIVPEYITESNATEDVVLSGDAEVREYLPKELQHNTLYYRWGWDRPIIPSTEGEETDRALSFLEEVDGIVKNSGADVTDFINKIEALRLPLMTYCHSSNLIKKGKAEDVNSLVEREAMSHPQMIAGGKVVNNPLVRTNQEIKQFNMANPDVQRVDLRHRGTPIAIPNKYVNQFTSHSSLARAILAKIVAGYTINVQGLLTSIQEYLKERLMAYQSSGMDITDDIYQKLQALWFSKGALFDQMVRGFRKVEKNADKIWNKTIVPSFEVVSELDNNGDPVLDDMGESVPVMDAKKRKSFKFDYMGWSFTGKGKEAPGSKSYRLNVGQGRKRMTYRHLQMILSNVTEPAPQNKVNARLPIDSADVFVDPQKRLRYSLDGMSSFYGSELRAQGLKTIGLPPLRDAKEGEGVEFDLKHLNLGGGHLAKNGEGVESLIQQFGPWAKSAWMQLKTAYQGPARSEASETFKVIDSGYFSAEVLLQQINNIKSQDDVMQAMQSFVNDHKTAKATASGAEYFVEDSLRNISKPFKATPENTKMFTEYGYYVAKMMDFTNALMRRSCVDVINPANGGPEITRYGEFYGTSSGIGGGGEILLSVLYAYKADLSSFAGSQQAGDVLEQKTKEEQKGGIRSELPVSQTDYTNIPQSEEKAKQRGIIDPLSGPTRNILYSENVRFWLGASSEVASADRGRSRFQQIAEGSSWHEIADIAYQKFPELEENTGTVIFDQLGASVDAIENAVKSAIRKTRDELQLVDNIEYQQADGGVEVIAGVAAAEPEPATPDTAVAPQVAPAPPVIEPAPTPEPVMPPQPEVQEQPTVPQQPKIPPQPRLGEIKDMEVNYIKKKNPKRQLVRNRRDPMTGKLEYASVLERLIRVADRFDRRGQEAFANKIDKLIGAMKED